MRTRENTLGRCATVLAVAAVSAYAFMSLAPAAATEPTPGIVGVSVVPCATGFGVSTPTPSLPAGVRGPMLASLNRYLVEDGVFSNITEVPFWYWKFYRRFFKDVSFELVVRNMPPGGVYHCRACR